MKYEETIMDEAVVTADGATAVPDTKNTPMLCLPCLNDNHSLPNLLCECWCHR